MFRINCSTIVCWFATVTFFLYKKVGLDEKWRKPQLAKNEIAKEMKRNLQAKFGYPLKEFITDLLHIFNNEPTLLRKSQSLLIIITKAQKIVPIKIWKRNQRNSEILRLIYQINAEIKKYFPFFSTWRRINACKYILQIHIQINHHNPQYIKKFYSR